MRKCVTKKVDSKKREQLVVTPRAILGRELGLLPECGPELVQDNWYRGHDQSDEAEERRRPSRGELVVHLGREQREASAEERTHDSVGGEG